MLPFRRAIVYNLGLLLLGALPLALALGYAAVVLSPPTWAPRMGRDLDFSSLASGAMFWYLILGLPVLFGGLLHHALLAMLPSRWLSLARRTAAVVSTPIVMLGIGLLSRNPGSALSWRVLTIAALPLLAYGLLVRLPTSPAETTVAARAPAI